MTSSCGAGGRAVLAESLLANFTFPTLLTEVYRVVQGGGGYRWEFREAQVEDSVDNTKWSDRRAVHY